MFSPELPETAIATFEALHDLRVTVHDFTGSLWPYLSYNRFQHAQSPCRAVKSAGFEKSCFAFDVQRLRREMALYPHGATKICHAGFLEWVVPVFKGEAIEWLFFAGIRRSEADVDVLLRQPPSGVSIDEEIPMVSEAQSQLILEHLRQVVARLRLWALEAEEEGGKAGPRTLRINEAPQRAVVVQRFIAQNHTKALRLRDIAVRLSLSEGRAGHVVQECCGQTFGRLLLEARLRTAMGLLRHSEIAVSEVARRSGFEDVRGFHRVFRREIGTSPARYRQSARS